jgi:hypothetical protein
VVRDHPDETRKIVADAFHATNFNHQPRQQRRAREARRHANTRSLPDGWEFTRGDKVSILNPVNNAGQEMMGFSDTSLKFAASIKICFRS